MISENISIIYPGRWAFPLMNVPSFTVSYRLVYAFEVFSRERGNACEIDRRERLFFFLLLRYAER
jgi:hypothetical protein